MFVLFGHSFVKRLRHQRGYFDIELSRGTYSIKCLGEGGLTIGRVLRDPQRYLNQLREASPKVLILDLGTNDLCSRENSPEAVHVSMCKLVKEFSSWGITPEVVVFLPVLPRTSGMRSYQVSLEEFNERVQCFNELLECSTFTEDRWWLWRHRSLRNPSFILDGVHLNQLGMMHYEKTLSRLVKFFEFRVL